MATKITIGETCIGLEVFPLVDGKEGVTQVMSLKETYRLIGQLSDAAEKLHVKLMCSQLNGNDTWVPASGGTEEPFVSRSGHRLLYCWNPGQQKHAYLDLDSDTILTDEEAFRYLGTV